MTVRAISGGSPPIHRQSTLARWGYGASGIWALLTAGALLWLFARSSRPRRRVAGGLDTVASAAVVAVTFGNWTREGFAGHSSADRALGDPAASLQVALAIAASSDLLRRRRLRRRLANLVVDLDHTAPNGDINQALGAVLGIESTAVAFPLGPDSYIDSEGRALPVEFIARSRSTPLVRDGRELAPAGQQRAGRRGPRRTDPGSEPGECPSSGLGSAPGQRTPGHSNPVVADRRCGAATARTRPARWSPATTLEPLVRRSAARPCRGFVSPRCRRSPDSGHRPSP